ncbi:hypothetical protein GYH30_025871 [Glycine max]|nr:hypothetical protein GYH30_025871 [Glycine max]
MALRTLDLLQPAPYDLLDVFMCNAFVAELWGFKCVLSLAKELHFKMDSLSAIRMVLISVTFLQVLPPPLRLYCL